MKGLVDADILVFRAGFAAERNKWFLKVGPPRGDWSVKEFEYKKDASAALDEALPGIHSREEGTDYQLWSERQIEPVENALHLVKMQINKIMEACDLTEFDVQCYLSGPTNFRYDVAKTRPYKGNRDAKHRPTHEVAIRDYIRSQWETVVTEGHEADDALGIAQCKADKDETCIISIDKDLNMIPGLHYDFLHELHYDITPDEGYKLFCLQVLTGDTTDNIPGLDGVGIKRAEKVLAGLPQDKWMEAVASEYASKSGKRDWFEYLMEQATLIWILRDTNNMGPPVPAELEDIGGQFDGTDEISLFD